jgi:hypothetical protein
MDQLEKKMRIGGRAFRLQVASWSLKLKGSFPTVSDAFIENSVKDTVVHLTTQPLPVGEEDIEVSVHVVPEPLRRFRNRIGDCSGGTDHVEIRGYKVSKETILKEIQRTTREIFGNENFPVDSMFKPFTPSSSANYINSRSKMGSYPIVMEVIKDLDLKGCLKTKKFLMRSRLEWKLVWGC